MWGGGRGRGRHGGCAGTKARSRWRWFNRTDGSCCLWEGAFHLGDFPFLLSIPGGDLAVSCSVPTEQPPREKVAAV